MHNVVDHNAAHKELALVLRVTLQPLLLLLCRVLLLLRLKLVLVQLALDDLLCDLRELSNLLIDDLLPLLEGALGEKPIQRV